MFGKAKKTMSAAGTYIMAMGREAGNLKTPKSSVTNTPPIKGKMSTALPAAAKYKDSGRVKLGAMGDAKKALR